MDIDLSILNNLFSKISDIKNNLTSTDTDKPLSAKQGKILNEMKIGYEDYFHIDTIDAEITYTDDTTETIPLLADITNIDGVQKVAVVWDDNDDEEGIRPSRVSPTLLQDGVKYKIPTMLNSDNNWQLKVIVPVDDGNGNAYTYEWQLTSVTGYSTYLRSQGNLTIFTVRKIPTAPPIPDEEYETPL